MRARNAVILIAVAVMLIGATVATAVFSSDDEKKPMVAVMQPTSTTVQQTTTTELATAFTTVNGQVPLDVHIVRGCSVVDVTLHNNSDSAIDVEISAVPSDGSTITKIRLAPAGFYAADYEVPVDVEVRVAGKLLASTTVGSGPRPMCQFNDQ